MSNLIEQRRLEKLIEKFKTFSEIKELTHVSATDGTRFPVYGISFGSKDKSAPTLGLFGGVHGLERIGTHLVLAYLETFYEVLQWDLDLQERLKEIRIVAMPLVNPVGMYMGLRSNANGVDLNRNAPIEADEEPAFILGGHRISSRLPWYRGKAGKSMEAEAQALCDFVRAEIFPSKVSLVVDVHSGFGAQDQLWYPYARTRDIFPRIREVDSLARLLTRAYPNHVYKIEAQSLNYTTHGDLWDYLFDEHWAQSYSAERVFIPLTLELGSWIWIRKNPTQLFSSLGPFNPIKAHRFKRIMRRHIPLIDFFLKAVRNHQHWALSLLPEPKI